MKNFFKITLIVLRSILIFIVVWGVTITFVKNMQKSILVENFKSKAVYQEDISTSSTRFYKIDSNEDKNAFTEDGIIYPGTSTDILVTTQVILTNNPLINSVVSFFAGGHAAFVNPNYGDYQINDVVGDKSTIEATGLEEGKNYSQVFDLDYWSYDDPYTEIIGLRVKLNDEKRREVTSLCSALIGDEYNYSFIFDTVNKSYCSDIISKAYKKIGVNLNKDGFATTIYDLICSGDCYISYYHVIKDNVKYIYYLD